MSHFLAVTAMGTDRPGIVYELAKLTSACDCDIIDSRVAIFGNEFTLIMLVAGDYSAITRLESELPVQAAQLDLMTIAKRTSRHSAESYTARLVVQFEGEDKRGTMRKITQFLADRELSLAGFSSHADKDDDISGLQQLEVRINLTSKVDLDDLEQSLQALAQQIGLSCNITRMENQVSD
ncbi:glycine cleavage system protein R [Ferrimonas lipolytica]|uniref:Glycine cleavage system transcriptional repressor n=1 Tax=Ferrimonas lipolytica TaxID=2724191 RepID=A0A6H1UE54_9GAMM|nr:ACT domain-containing protein [Ferrimonas lipolytica]QIZ76909.1 ACT domain-containing protein [Ferrimonas lipolytica]